MHLGDLKGLELVFDYASLGTIPTHTEVLSNVSNFLHYCAIHNFLLLKLVLNILHQFTPLIPLLQNFLSQLYQNQ